MTDQNKQIVIEDIINHRKASSQAFKTAHLLFITLGQNEAWLDNKNGLIWAHRPPQDILDKDPSRFIVKTFEQAFIEEELKKGLLTLFKVNPDLKVIFSVSPVPAYATFQSKGVITESFHNKCLLRVVVERTIQQFPDRTFYFPSFEMVMSYNPGSLIADNRHVRRKVVERIMNSLDSSVM